jgi:hypothetical protein
MRNILSSERGGASSPKLAPGDSALALIEQKMGIDLALQRFELRFLQGIGERGALLYIGLGVPLEQALIEAVYSAHGFKADQVGSAFARGIALGGDGLDNRHALLFPCSDTR